LIFLLRKGYSTNRIIIVKIVIGIDVEVAIVAPEPRGSFSPFTVLSLRLAQSKLRLARELSSTAASAVRFLLDVAVEFYSQ